MFSLCKYSRAFLFGIRRDPYESVAPEKTLGPTGKTLGHIFYRPRTGQKILCPEKGFFTEENPPEYVRICTGVWIYSSS